MIYINKFLFSHRRYHAEYNVSEFSDFVGETEIQSTLAELEMNSDDTEYNDEEISDCVKIVMKDAPIIEELKKKKIDFNNAKQLGDEILQLKLATELIDLQKKLQSLKSNED